jgi:hypothetical protein
MKLPGSFEPGAKKITIKKVSAIRNEWLILLMSI